MCYGIAQALKAQELEERFSAKLLNAESYQPFYFANAFNHPLVPVITSDDPGAIQMFQWGLIPGWVKDDGAAAEISLKTINARSETAFDRPAFGQSVRERRCLVLVSGFFEWRAQSGRKYPYHIWLSDTGGFAIAGIYDRWVDPGTGEVRNTFSVLTTAANPLLEQIHNTKKRMPVILPMKSEQLWLNRGLERSGIEGMLKPYAATCMSACPVTKAIGRPGKTQFGPEAIHEKHYPELAPLTIVS